jgi:hypothetical protein
LTDFVGVSCIVDSLSLGCLLRNSILLECFDEDFTRWDVLTEFVGVSCIDSLLLECLLRNSNSLECLDILRWNVSMQNSYRKFSVGMSP